MNAVTNKDNLHFEVKRLEPTVINKSYKYNTLTAGTKVLVTRGGATADHVITRLRGLGCNVTVLGGNGDDTEQSVGVVEGTVMRPEACARAAAGQEVVLHAGRPPADMSKWDSARYITEGTLNLLKAAIDGEVKRFVYLSSTSVVFGGDDLKGVAEDTPYPARYVDLISAATAEAEKAVLACNGTAQTQSATLATCSVRAAPVYGPGDEEPLLLDLVNRAGYAGYVQLISEGKNVMDFLYAGNAAHALLLAAEGLCAMVEDSDLASNEEQTSTVGRSFFITDGEPVPLVDFVGGITGSLGYRAPKIGLLPQALAFVLSFFLRFIAIVASPIVTLRPNLTPRRVMEEGKYQYFDISLAKRELGYSPLWTQKEGIEITAQGSKSMRNPKAKLKYLGPFTKEDVAAHDDEDDVWIIVDNKVYDVTPYVGSHPGGDAILRNAGGDSSTGMHGPQHPAQAMEILEQHYIGDMLPSSG